MVESNAHSRAARWTLRFQFANLHQTIQKNHRNVRAQSVWRRADGPLKLGSRIETGTTAEPSGNLAKLSGALKPTSQVKRTFVSFQQRCIALIIELWLAHLTGSSASDHF